MQKFQELFKFSLKHTSLSTDMSTDVLLGLRNLISSDKRKNCLNLSSTDFFSIAVCEKKEEKVHTHTSERAKNTKSDWQSGNGVASQRPYNYYKRERKAPRDAFCMILSLTSMRMRYLSRLLHQNFFKKKSINSIRVWWN